MSNSNGHITLPINIKADIGYVLGTGNGDLGYNIVNGNINKWAKYKPVRRSGLIDTSGQLNAQRTGWKSDANWWRGDDGQCGLAFDTFNTLGSPATSGTFFYKLIHELMSWTYNRPRGRDTHNEWFRAFDFFHYDHNVPAPVDQPAATTIMLNSSNELVLDIPVNRGTDYSLSFADFSINNQSLSGFYFGILVYLANNQYTFKADHLVSSGDIATTLANLSGYAGRTVKVAPFLSSRSISQGIDAGSGVYLSAGVQAFDVLIRPYSTGISATISAQWMESLHARVHYVLNLVNVSQAAITATNIVIALYRSDIQGPLKTRTIASQTVPVGDTPIEIQGNFLPDEPYDSTKTYTVVVTSDNNVVSASTEVDEYRA